MHAFDRFANYRYHLVPNVGMDDLCDEESSAMFQLLKQTGLAGG